MKKIPFLRWIFFSLNILAAFALLLSYTASFIDPKAIWMIAFFGLAYPFLLLANILFVIYWLFRLKLHILLSLAVIIAGWQHHQNIFAFRSEKQTTIKSDSTLKVLSYNAHLFKAFSSNKYEKKTKHEMLGMLIEAQAGVLCFQEFYTRKRGEYAIKDSLMKYAKLPYVYMKDFDTIDAEVLAIATFSKYPIVHKEHLRFYERKHANTCIITDIKFGKDTIRVFNIHLQSINFQPEDYEYLDKVTQKAETDVKSSKRIGSRLKQAFIRRSNQAELVADAIMDSPYPVIVCGDFNDTPISFAYHTIMKSKELKNAFREKGSGFGITYGGAFPNFQIDYILCDPSFRVNSYHVIKKKYSDHYPIVAEINIP